MRERESEREIERERIGDKERIEEDRKRRHIQLSKANNVILHNVSDIQYMRIDK